MHVSMIVGSSSDVSLFSHTPRLSLIGSDLPESARSLRSYHQSETGIVDTEEFSN